MPPDKKATGRIEVPPNMLEIPYSQQNQQQYFKQHEIFQEKLKLHLQDQ